MLLPRKYTVNLRMFVDERLLERRRLQPSFMETVTLTFHHDGHRCPTADMRFVMNSPGLGFMKSWKSKPTMVNLTGYPIDYLMLGWAEPQCWFYYWFRPVMRLWILALQVGSRLLQKNVGKRFQCDPSHSLKKVEVGAKSDGFVLGTGEGSFK